MNQVMDTALEYLEYEEQKVSYLWWQKQNLSYTATGYGAKIPTSWMVRIGKRWYRVYCCIYSNIGSCYIMKNKRRQYIVI